MKRKASRNPRMVVAALLAVSTVALAAEAQQGNADKGAQKPAPAAKQAPAKQEDLVQKVKVWVEDKRVWALGHLNKLKAQYLGQPNQGVAKKPALPAPAKGVSQQPGVPGAGARGTASAPGAATQANQGNPVPAASSERNAVDPVFDGNVVSDLPKSASGVPVLKIEANVEEIPRLDIGKEKRVSASDYALPADQLAFMDKMVAYQKESPALLTPKDMMALTKPRAQAPKKPEKIKTAFFEPKGRVSRAGIDAVSIALTPEAPLALAKFVPLTQDELRFLSGLLLYQQGDKCAVAVGLFHELSKTKKYDTEGSYYLAMCSKQLGLVTDFIDRARHVIDMQDSYYAKKIMPEISPDVPYEYLEPLGRALVKVSGNKEIMSFANDKVAGNIYYIMANYGAQTANYKLASQYGKMVPEKHEKWAPSQFLMALGEYQTGSKSKALDQQEELVSKLNADKTKAEFQALVAMNLARMYFQEKKFKQAHEWFLKVYKDHPLWLQSLQEMGWAQLQSGDYEGAIGNMYSVQSPYFQAVYKPESYVIRTIGYLNLCQYGDAYRTLTVLEKSYRPWLDKMAAYQKGPADYMATVRKFLATKSANAEIDGLPSQIVREMVRHKDYLNLQNALNRQIDEQDFYKRLDAEVEKSLRRSRWLVNNSRKRANDLRAQIASIKKNPQLEANRLAWKAELDNELDLLNGYFFEIDLFNEAKSSLQSYKSEVVAGADKRIASMRSRIVTVLSGRMKRMREDLGRMLDNNELLRYEVFAGSGENIRFQVAGGEKGNRVPANVIPQSKSLQWDFDGEYWEDEVGHYRSSLKNNCPDSGNQNEHASL